MKGKIIPIREAIIKFGVIFGIARIIFSLTSYLSGYYANQGLAHLIILFFITVISIVIGQLIFKKSNNGFISLREALKISIGISLLGGLMAVLWKVLLIKVIDPEIITQLEDNHIKRIAETSADFTQENIERTLAINKKHSSSWRMITKAIIEDLFYGFLFGLISGLIIRKKRDPFK